MNLYFFVIIILFSVPIILVNAEPDIDFLVYKGGQYLKLFDYSKAISIFDLVLSEEPDNVDALYYKGVALAALGNNKEAMGFYEKALSINPQKQEAIIKLQELLLENSTYEFGFLDGVLEVKVHDSKGKLIAFLRATKIKALEHDIVKDLIEKWPVAKIVTHENQKLAVHQKEFLKQVERTTILGFHEIPYSESVDIPLAATWHYQIPVEKGDVVSYAYSIYRPVL